MTSRRDRLVERRIELVSLSHRYVVDGATDRAVQALAEAVAIGRELIELEADSARIDQARELATVLSALATLLGADHRYADAVEALTEAIELFGSVGTEAQRLEAVADRGLYRCAAGADVSAIMDFDEAAVGYDRLPTEDAEAQSKKLAHLFSVAVAAMRRTGDPDLAVGMADFAIRELLQYPGESGPRSLDFARATQHAAELHYLHGRTDLAEAANGLAREVALSTQSNDLAAAAVRSAFLINVPSVRETMIGAARGLDSETVDLTIARLTEPPAPTLAEAIDLAQRRRPTELPIRSLEFDPRGNDRFPVPSQRCGQPGMRVPFGLALADGAAALADDFPDASSLLALEAHYLFAAASADRRAGLGFGLGHYGRVWGETLILAAEHHRRIGRAAVQHDLLDWLRGLILQLAPHALQNARLSAAVDRMKVYVEVPD